MRLNLDKSSPVPLYYQLAELIRLRIESGELKPGDRLASARMISEDAEISRMTVRQAVDYLVRQGHLEVRRGAGTYIAQPKLTYHAVNLLGFTQEMMKQGLHPSSQVLEQIAIEPPAEVQSRLRLEPGHLVVKVVRLRLSQDVPVLLETVYLPRDACPGLEHDDLSGLSLYEVLEKRYALRPWHSTQALEATVASDPASGLLEVPVGTPMILLEGVTYGRDDHPLEYFTALFRGDRFRFELEVHQPDGAGGDGTRPAIMPLLTAIGPRA
jgi:GntR family transcriptional regulator